MKFRLLFLIFMTTVSTAQTPSADWIRFIWTHNLPADEVGKYPLTDLKAAAETLVELEKLKTNTKLLRLINQVQFQTGCKVVYEVAFLKSPKDVAQFQWFGYRSILYVEGSNTAEGRIYQVPREVDAQKFYNLGEKTNLLPSADRLLAEMEVLKQKVEREGVRCDDPEPIEVPAPNSVVTQLPFGKPKESSVGFILDRSDSAFDKNANGETYLEVAVAHLIATLKRMQPWQKFSVAFACPSSAFAYREYELVDATPEEIQRIENWISSSSSVMKCEEYLHIPMIEWDKREFPQRIVVYTDGFLRIAGNISFSEAEPAILDDSLKILAKHKTKVDIAPLPHEDYFKLAKDHFAHLPDPADISGAQNDWTAPNFKIIMRNMRYIPEIVRATGGKIFEPATTKPTE